MLFATIFAPRMHQKWSQIGAKTGAGAGLPDLRECALGLGESTFSRIEEAHKRRKNDEKERRGTERVFTAFSVAFRLQNGAKKTTETEQKSGAKNRTKKACEKGGWMHLDARGRRNARGQWGVWGVQKIE